MCGFPSIILTHTSFLHDSRALFTPPHWQFFPAKIDLEERAIYKDKMGAPTARKTAEIADQPMAESTPLPAEEETTELLDMKSLDAPDAVHAIPESTEDEVMIDESARPRFAPAQDRPLAFRRELRKVPVPPHRVRILYRFSMDTS